MGEQQSRLRTQVWCQNTCQNCMSGTDIDNAVAAQTELNRRNGTANGGGTIIPREELQKLLKQQTLLPSSQQHRINDSNQQQIADQNFDMYAGKTSGGSLLSQKRPDNPAQQQIMQSLSSPNNNGGAHRDTNLATMGRKDSHDGSGRPSAKKSEYLAMMDVGQHAQSKDLASAQSSAQQKLGATERIMGNDLTGQQSRQFYQQQLMKEAQAYDSGVAVKRKQQSTISSPSTHINHNNVNADGTQQLHNVMQVHQSHLREAQRVQREQRKPSKMLHLRVLSSAFLQKGQVITINENGLASQEPLRKAYDGVTYFGCKRTLPKQLANGEMEADSGAPAMVHESASEEDNSSAALDQAISGMKEVVNDFIIPACKKEDKEKHAGRQFQIRFDPYNDTYYIKDLQIGYGVFTETVGPVPLKDNLLINMGESYIVTNLSQPDPEIVSEYASNNAALADHQEGSQPPVKLKLRVFSVSKSDQPDLHCCQFEEQEVVIGRSPNCDIRVDDELLSKMQASINFDLNSREWVLQDGYQGKRSTNGTWLYLNEEIPIQSGMLFKSNQTFFQATFE